MTIEAKRIFDIAIIKDIMTSNDIWNTNCEDGHNPDYYKPDLDSSCWLLIKNDDVIIGIYALEAVNSITVQIHANIYKKYRSKYRIKSAIAALTWLYHNAEEYKKIIATVAVIYPNVKRFACEIGFKVEGINRLSCRKNGKIVDQWMLGITRDEVEVTIYESR